MCRVLGSPLSDDLCNDDSINNTTDSNGNKNILLFVFTRSLSFIFLQNTTYSLFQLVDDPIFIPIEQLEQKDGKPEEFSSVVQDIKAGKTGHLRIEKGRKAVHKVI